MIKRISIILLFLAAAIFNVSAQTMNDVYAAKSSTLSAIDLPPDALRVRDAKVPVEIKNLLAKMIEAGGSQVRQGESEVFIWSGKNFKETDNQNRFKQIETSLKNSGWTYETANADECLFFSAINKEAGRALVGILVPTNEVFLFAVTEMLRNDAPASAAK